MIGSLKNVKSNQDQEKDGIKVSETLIIPIKSQTRRRQSHFHFTAKKRHKLQEEIHSINLFLNSSFQTTEAGKNV